MSIKAGLLVICAAVFVLISGSLYVASRAVQTEGGAPDQVGRDLQLSMVPRAFPAFPERHDVSVYATPQPAREVGGDFYDFYSVDDTRLLFCVGDVSDKGVPAALFMAVTKTLIKARSAEEPSTAKLVTHVNAELARDNAKCMFVTLFLGRLDVSTGELVYTNAGHDPPYVCRFDGSLQRLAERHGPLAGVAPGAVYGESRRRLGPGDLLIAYTDGVTEARDAHGQLFSEDRMTELVRVDGPTSTQAAVERILAAVETFERGAERADDGVPFDPLVAAPPDTSLPLEPRDLGGLGIHLAAFS